MDIPIEELAKHGLLGTLLFISLSINFYFYKQIKKLYEKRIEDAKSISSQIMQPMQSIQRSIGLLIDVVTNKEKKYN